MKLVIYADPHWSRTSSILRQNGEKYSVRLENLISSLNFVERFAHDFGADAVVCLGDFFDASRVSAEEMRALSEVKFGQCEHYFIVGNHETTSVDNKNNLASVFSLKRNFKVFESPTRLPASEECEICFLPYIHPSEQKTIGEYFGNKGSKRRIIFSHNDIKGLQYGQFVSTEGFEVEDISSECNLFINGHLHNHSVSGNIVNIGNLTGQNFSEDATKYSHFIMVLDTDSGEYEFVKNPYALNFYHFDDAKSMFATKINNAVVSVFCSEAEYEDVKKYLEERALSYKISINDINSETSVVQNDKIEDIRVSDHISVFAQYVLNNIGNSEIIQEELNKVIK